MFYLSMSAVSILSTVMIWSRQNHFGREAGYTDGFTYKITVKCRYSGGQVALLRSADSFLSS